MSSLSSLTEFTDADLHGLATVAQRSFDSENLAPAWLGLWHELMILATAELDRRASVLQALDRDVEQP